MKLVFAFALAALLACACGSAPPDVEPPTHQADGYSGASQPSPDAGTAATAEPESELEPVLPADAGAE